VCAVDLAVEEVDGGNERAGGGFHGPSQHRGGRQAPSGEHIDSIETAAMAPETLGDGCLREVDCLGGPDDLPQARQPPGAKAAGLQQSRKVTPGLLAPAMGEAVAPSPQIASDARPLAQSAKRGIGGFELAPAGAECRGHFQHVAAAVSGSSQRAAAAKAVNLLLMDGAAASFGSCGRPGCHLAQTSAAVFENTLSNIVPSCPPSGMHGGFPLSKRRR
jgi:hypothetical protein